VQEFRRIKYFINALIKMSFVTETEKIYTNAATINNIPIQHGTPTSGQSLVYNSTTNQWAFDQFSGSGSTGPTGPAGTGPTGPAGPTQPATGTDLGAIQLAGDLTGAASAPYISTYPSNMEANISRYTLLGQNPLTGRTGAIPIAISTDGNIGPFEFASGLIGIAQFALSLKCSSPSPPVFTAWGSGYVSRIGGNVPSQLGTIQGVTITTVSQVLVKISNPIIAGCGENESEKWDIYLTGSDNTSYYLQLFFFNNSNVSTGPVFAALYGIKV